MVNAHAATPAQAPAEQRMQEALDCVNGAILSVLGAFRKDQCITHVVPVLIHRPFTLTEKLARLHPYDLPDGFGDLAAIAVYVTAQLDRASRTDVVRTLTHDCVFDMHVVLYDVRLATAVYPLLRRPDHATVALMRWLRETIVDQVRYVSAISTCAASHGAV